MKYFANFPIMTYANTAARDIFARVKFDKTVESYTKHFYPYQLQQGDRPDIVAYGYYDDAFADWLVYFANKIVDPYYDYHLNQQQFDAFIEQKYGSISAAQSKIYGYRNNWSEDDTVLTISAYDALPSNLKKFWNPVLGYSGTITGYDRAKQDTYLTTNKVVSLTVILQSNTQFVLEEKVTQYNGSTPVANGVVAFANSSTAIVQHIEGEFVANTTYTVKGNESQANAVASSVTTIKQNYANNEAIYYSSYTYYDYENELNSQKQSIDLIDNRYSSTIERQFKQLMNK